MIKDTFIQSPEYQDYKDNKDNISKESIVFVEEQGKEKLIEHSKEFDFVPSGGEEGQVLTKGEEGLEWKDSINSDDVYTKEETDKKINEVLNGINTNGYDYVDMGEAGIWATCNIGASKPEEIGLYFAWAGTDGYKNKEDKPGGFVYSKAPYFLSAMSESSIKWSKYVENSSNGIVDNLTTLELEDDAAHINMGGSWRMPTEEECTKLIKLCNSEVIANYNNSGISGVLVTLKTDESKKIFFPTNTDSKSISLWTSSKSSNDKECEILYINENSSKQLSINYMPRYSGLFIRGFIPTNDESSKYLTKKEVDETYAKKDELKEIIGDTDLKNVVTFNDIVTEEKNGILGYDKYKYLNYLYNRTSSSSGIPLTIVSVDSEKDKQKIKISSIVRDKDKVIDYTTKLSYVDILAATPTTAGVMSADDKKKLNDISKEWFGTKEEYDELESYDNRTKYYILKS